MRLAMLMPLALTALLVFPQARADEEAESPPPKPDVATGLWETHAKTFDLDGDGKITWEEYQKVTSGFTFLDADKDGVITKSDVDALGEKLAHGIHESHAAVFLGTPGGGFHQAFGGPRSGDADGLMRLLPLLLGAQGGHGLQGLPFPRGMWGGLQGFPVMGGMRGGCGQPGCRARTGMQILPWLFAGMLGTEHPRAPSSLGAELDGDEHAVAKTIVHMIPASMKRLAAFGLVAHRADADDDHVITKAEWTAAAEALTKEDGSLDLAGAQEGVGIHGMPFPGGNTALLEVLLDTNGDGRVDAQDLVGVFEKADKNGDGKVDQDELMPSGMGMFHGR